MAKKRRQGRSRHGGRTPSWPGMGPTSGRAQHGRIGADPPLMRDIRDALADPLAMLALVSTLLAVVDPRSADPFARVPERGRDQMTRAKLIESFVAVERPETSALLSAIPRFETDTWPAARVLVEWAARLLPEGGAGYVRPQWPDEARQELADRFLASRHAAALDRRDAPGLLESLLWFGCDYGPGDPMRWSPTVVEILLGDWIPRKIVADVAYLRKAPAVLRAFIRFCHEERGIRPTLTAETLAAVDLWEPAYQATIRSARLQGAEAILAAVGALDPDTPWPPFERAALDALIVERLERAVGGPQTLATLGDDPLPDEPFDWNDVAEDIRDRVTEVVVLCDEYCETVLDIEYRTAARRLLAAVASGDPAVFRRKARADTAAAAICWIIGKANELFEPSAGGMLAKDLTAHFGSNGGSPSQRAATLLRAAGLRDATYGAIALDSPRYLVSAQRRRIIERRDRYRD